MRNIQALIAGIIISCLLCRFDSAAAADFYANETKDISLEDLEIINDLDMLENWDDLQNAEAFEGDVDDEHNAGVDHDE